MPLKESLYNRVGINRAEAEMIQHPLIGAINQHLPRITELNHGYSQITDNQAHQTYFRENYGFLGDAIVEAAPFQLTPPDMVALWSRVMKVFPSVYQRYGFARMVVAGYAVYGTENPDWKTFPRYFLEKGDLPPGVENDRLGLTYVSDRLFKVGHAVEHIRRPLFTAKEPREDSTKEYKQDYELLKEVAENFANGNFPLIINVHHALRNLPPEDGANSK